MQNSINPFNIRPANRVNNISEYYFSKKLKEIAELNAPRFGYYQSGHRRA